MPAPITPHDFPEIRWQGHWIWVPEEPIQPGEAFSASAQAQALETHGTIGECWGWGTHAHGWSCTPTRDMIFYTLGVTPAEPGYTQARIAPRLGRLAWVKGSVPPPMASSPLS